MPWQTHGGRGPGAGVQAGETLLLLPKSEVLHLLGMTGYVLEELVACRPVDKRGFIHGSDGSAVVWIPFPSSRVVAIDAGRRTMGSATVSQYRRSPLLRWQCPLGRARMRLVRRRNLIPPAVDRATDGSVAESFIELLLISPIPSPQVEAANAPPGTHRVDRSCACV
jgi:hypothetical protein